MFAKFDEIPAMTLQGQCKVHTAQSLRGYKHISPSPPTLRKNTRTGNVKKVYPPQIKFVGSINICPPPHPGDLEQLVGTLTDKNRQNSSLI